MFGGSWYDEEGESSWWLCTKHDMKRSFKTWRHKHGWSRSVINVGFGSCCFEVGDDDEDETIFEDFIDMINVFVKLVVESNLCYCIACLLPLILFVILPK